MKHVWAINEATGQAHRFRSEVEFEYGSAPVCGAERGGSTWHLKRKDEGARRCPPCADFGLTPHEVEKVNALRKALVGRSFVMAPGVFELGELRRRVQVFVGPTIENAWSKRIYERAEREGHEIVPWVTARYEEAIARLEAGSPLEVAGDG